jgi:hypothetical protein
MLATQSLPSTAGKDVLLCLSGCWQLYCNYWKYFLWFKFIMMLLFGSFTRKRRFHNLLFKKGVRSEFILATMWDWHEIWRMHIWVVHLNICAIFTSFPCLWIYFYVIQWLKFMFWLFTYQLKWRNMQDNSTCYRWSFKVLSVHHNNISGTIFIIFMLCAHSFMITISSY